MGSVFTKYNDPHLQIYWKWFWIWDILFFGSFLDFNIYFWVMQCLWYRQIWINYLSEQLYLLLLYIINMKRQVYWVFINKIVTAMESLLRVFFGRTVCKRKNSAVKMFLPVTILPSILTSDQINVDYHRVKHKKTSA